MLWTIIIYKVRVIYLYLAYFDPNPCSSRPQSKFFLLTELESYTVCIVLKSLSDRPIVFQEKSELALLQYKQWMTLASREIDQIRQELELLEKNLNFSDATLQLRTELTNLKNKVRSIFPVD